MDNESAVFKRILVDLEDKHEHLKSSVDHLRREISKREVEIERFVTEKELESTKEDIAFKKSRSCHHFPTQANINDTYELRPQYSSDFTAQVGQLIDNINRTTQEISALIKL